MPIYTTRLDGRDANKLKLTYDEAVAMVQAGFRFSIFDIEDEDFRLSLPYSLARDMDRDALTLMQDA